jgi:hypothetical protein
MRKICFILTVVIIFLSVDCEKNKDELKNNTQFLVNKIYDYNNNLVGDYKYDNQNRLTKIIKYFYDTEDGRRIDYEFEYQNDKVSTIKYIEYQYPQSIRTIMLTYNNRDKIINKKALINDNLIVTQYYKYYEDGKLKCLTDKNGNDNYFFIYDETENVIQVRWLYIDIWFSGDTIEMYRNFVYDNMPKPSFRIDYLFFIEPLPGFGDEATLEKGVSINNMIEYVESGTKWTYTYDENNLPKTIETKWKDIETLEPMMLRIEYRQIN